MVGCRAAIAVLDAFETGDFEFLLCAVVAEDDGAELQGEGCIWGGVGRVRLRLLTYWCGRDRGGVFALVMLPWWTRESGHRCCVWNWFEGLGSASKGREQLLRASLGLVWWYYVLRAHFCCCCRLLLAAADHLPLRMLRLLVFSDTGIDLPVVSLFVCSCLQVQFDVCLKLQ